MSGLRQSFLNGALTRLLDPDSVLRFKVCEFVGKGDFGLGSNQRPDGSFDRVWFDEMVDPAEVTFDKDVFLLTKAAAKKLNGPAPVPGPAPEPPGSGSAPAPGPSPAAEPQPPTPSPTAATVRVSGVIPPELWNRLETRLLPKLRAGSGLSVHVELSAKFEAGAANSALGEIAQVLDELGVKEQVEVKLEGE